MTGSGFGVDVDLPVFAISVASELAGLHPQTLRQYDRLGLVVPQRTGGKTRLYSLRDIEDLKKVAFLSSQGVSLEGVAMVLELQAEVARLKKMLGDQSSVALVVRQRRAD